MLSTLVSFEERIENSHKNVPLYIQNLIVLEETFGKLMHLLKNDKEEQVLDLGHTLRKETFINARKVYSTFSNISLRNFFFLQIFLKIIVPFEYKRRQFLIDMIESKLLNQVLLISKNKLININYDFFPLNIPI